MTILKELQAAQQKYRAVAKELLLKTTDSNNMVALESSLTEVVDVVVSTSEMGLIDSHKHKSITDALIKTLQDNIIKLQGGCVLPTVSTSPLITLAELFAVDEKDKTPITKDNDLPIGWCCRSIPQSRYDANNVLAAIRDKYTDMRFTRYSKQSENESGRHVKQYCINLNEMLGGRPLMTIHTEVGHLIGIIIATNPMSVEIRPLWLSGTRGICLSAVTVVANLSTGNARQLPAVIQY